MVKVQRPGLKDLFDIDLKNLRVSFLNTLESYAYSSFDVWAHFLLFPGDSRISSKD